MIENEEDLKAYLSRARDEAFTRGLREAESKGTGLYFAEVGLSVGDKIKTTYVFACVNSTAGMHIHPGARFFTAENVRLILERAERGAAN